MCCVQTPIDKLKNGKSFWNENLIRWTLIRQHTIRNANRQIRSRLLQGWSNYPTWLDMGPMMSNQDFMRLRESHYWLIYPLAVIPGMISLGLNLALVLLKPEGVS